MDYYIYAMDKSTFKELSAQYKTALITQLFPLHLAEDFAEFDAQYRKQFGMDRWRARRSALASDVDAIILEILSNEHTHEQITAILRKVPNETLLFYFERLMSVSYLLAEFEKTEPDKFIAHGSYKEIWLDMLTKHSKLIW
jgi:hypothetical protein